jgi:hypothetical protein
VKNYKKKVEKIIMARKTFIFYKHSEAQGLRNSIIKKLGDDASYYTGGNKRFS